MQQPCSRCGNGIAPGASICGFCGAPVATAYPPQSGYPGSREYGGYPQSAPTVVNPYAGPYNPAGQSAPSFPYGQTTYGAPSLPSEQVPYGAPSSPYGQTTYGAPPGAFYGAPPQSPFGAPGQPFIVGAPPQPPPRKTSPLLWIGIIVIVVLVLGGGAYILFGSGKGSPLGAAPTATSIPPLYQANLTSDPGGWNCSNTSCAFQNDGYHIQAPDGALYESVLTSQSFNDLVIQVNVAFVQGDPTDAGLGITFRLQDNDGQNGYFFAISDDGRYLLDRLDTGIPSGLLDVNRSNTIKTGLGVQNTFKIAINGAQFTVSVNGQQLAQVSDSSYSGGYIGLADFGTDVTATEAVFSNLIVTRP